ncbi:MAG: PD-(D/E)XK nuclease family protein [Actinomycetota bacterium]|nr:PD-(D/E)XK nuclease family protein [Actinomycetota bacterium]
MLSELMALGQPRPRFGSEVAASLRDELERALAPVVHEPLSVNKRDLSQVHACETHYSAQADEAFAWNVRNGVGTVVHRAVELSVAAPADRHPLDLVGQAIESLAADDPRNAMRDYLQNAPESVLNELRAAANEAVVKFQECWPPLQRAWKPRAEMRIRAQLCDGRLELQGKVDLALGLPRGDEARELFVDLKTGRSYPSHLDDLRFYALVQLLRAGVAPFRVASYYFDTATFHHEDVTLESLEIALRRTIDGVEKLCALRRGDRAPTITPGPTCSYCRLNDTCDGARQWQEDR